MPGESPGRDWDTLLRPPSDFDKLRDERALKRARRIERIRLVFSWIVIGVTFLGWLSLLPWAMRPPDPWIWLSLGGWLALLGVLLFIVGVILRQLERLLLRWTLVLE
jgi:hypothetical protein